MGFAICKAEQPLKDMELQEKKHNTVKACRKSLQKEPTVNRCLLILDFKAFRSQFKGNHSLGRELQSLATQGK